MPIKYILPSKKSYPVFDICVTAYVKSVIFYLASTYYVLFEVTFLFKLTSLSSKSVFLRKAEISFLLAKFACANLTAKSCDVNLLNSWILIYLASSWSVIFYLISLIFVS